jgi:Peptidase A4 family
MNKLVTAALTLGLLFAAIPGQAATNAQRTWVTRGWAGYVVRAGDRSFNSATASWTQPRVVCNRPGSSAAFWIGLGGARAGSKSLEQIGTSADCSERAVVSYSAWYQLFPAPPVELTVSVAPGDRLTASVSVTAGIVGLSLRNNTSGEAFSTEIWMRAPETDSAEWIVEAPSACFATCAPLPLADFGTARFTSAATSVDAHAGAIGDGAWSRLRLEMAPQRGRKAAAATRLSADGSSFTVRRLHR